MNMKGIDRIGKHFLWSPSHKSNTISLVRFIILVCGKKPSNVCGKKRQYGSLNWLNFVSIFTFCHFILLRCIASGMTHQRFDEMERESLWTQPWCIWREVLSYFCQTLRFQAWWNDATLTWTWCWDQQGRKCALQIWETCVNDDEGDELNLL